MDSPALKTGNEVKHEEEHRSLLHSHAPHLNVDTKLPHYFVPKSLSITDCAKVLIVDSIPNIIYGVAVFLLLTINMHYLSKKGRVAEIDGIGLGNTWINATTISVILALNTGLTTFASQAYGAKNYRLVGLYFHRAIIIRMILIIPSYCLLLASYRIFLALNVDDDVAEQAHIYCVYSLGAMIAMVVYDSIKSFVIGHNVFYPILAIQLVVTFSHWGWCELFIDYMRLGVKGASFAFTLSQTVGAIIIFVYVKFNKFYSNTFFMFNEESFQGLFSQFKNECLVGAFLYLEWVAYEICTLMAGRFDKYQVAAQVIVFNIIALIYMIPMGLGICTTTYVGNAIGDKDVKTAKNYIKASVAICTFLVIIEMIVIILIKRDFIEFYDHRAKIYTVTAPVLTIYIIALPADFYQLIFASVLKGIGQEKQGSVIFVICYYFVGILLAYIFGVSLNMYDRGIWIGMGVGIYLMFILSLILVLNSNFRKQCESVDERLNTDSGIALISYHSQPSLNDEEGSATEVEQLRQDDVIKREDIRIEGGDSLLTAEVDKL